MKIQNIIFEKPIFTDKTPTQKIAILDKWVSDTTDKLNYLVSQMNGEDDDE